MTIKDYPASVTARHVLIGQWLASEGRVDVGDIAARLGVAQETVRRDLRALESEGRLQRVHGGAVAIDSHPFPVQTLTPIANRAQVALAELVWSELPRDGTIVLGTGHLTLAVAQLIVADPPQRAGLTVVTSSLDAAIALARVPELAVYNIGGTVSATTRGQEGDWALHELQRLHVDVGLVCPTGVSLEHGLGQHSPGAAAVAQAEVACARSTFALVEAADLGRPAFVQFADLEAVDRLIVAGTPDSAVVTSFRERGISVTVVEVPPMPVSEPHDALTAAARSQ